MELLTQGSWRSVGASIAGVSHNRTGQPCQDAFGYGALDDGTVVAAVADGAGSAEFGGLGSQMTIQVAVDFLSAELAKSKPLNYPEWVALFQRLLKVAQNVITERAKNQGDSVRDFASTLLIIVASPRQVVSASIGDCAAVIQLSCGHLYSLCPPQRGEYANATHFITSSDASQRLVVGLQKFYAANAITHIALMTDGLLELALNVAQNRPFVPFFQPLFGFISDLEAGKEDAASEDLANFLNSDRVNSRTHDDKTLVLLSSNL